MTLKIIYVICSVALLVIFVYDIICSVKCEKKQKEKEKEKEKVIRQNRN